MMRYPLFTTLLLFVLTFAVQAQPNNWRWQNPLPTGSTLRDCFFFDENLGWAVGEAGIIIRTQNGGIDWQNQTPNFSSLLYDVNFANGQTGWAVGENGIILKTTNGGSSWNQNPSGTTKALYSVYFLDFSTGFAVGKDGLILKSSNGGEEWTTQTSGVFEFLNSVFFVDQNTGWAVGGFGKIIKTTNGGANWISQISGSTNNLISTYFVNEQVGWATGDNGTLLKTTNGGASWQPLSINFFGSINSVKFFNAQVGWLVGEYGKIYKSSNGGNSWVSQNSGTSKPLFSIYPVNQQKLWVVGESGITLRSNNGGTNWEKLSFGNDVSLASVHFANGQHGWTVGFNGAIFKTTDGGRNWLNQISGFTNNLHAIYSINEYTAWAVGDNGLILKTENGGLTWNSQNSGNSFQLNSVFFNDPLTGWVVGNLGTILKTTNGGISWQSQYGNLAHNFYSIHFSTPQIGWVVGNNGRILRTTNGGSNWQSQFSATNTLLTSVKTVSTGKVWAVGYGGTIVNTINGENWQIQQSDFSYDLFSVSFLDTLNGWSVGSYGKLLKTTNGGFSWEAYSVGTEKNINSICFFTPQKGWIVGNGGTILTSGPDNIGLGVPTSLIEGTITQKTNTNCIPNPMDPMLPGLVVKALPGPFYGISNSMGKFKMRLPIDSLAISNYSLSAMPLQNFGFQANPVCPIANQYLINLGTNPDTISGKDFGFEVPQCHQLNIQISSNRRRRCFRNLTTVSYTNLGSISAPNAYVLVAFPRWVRGISATAPYVVLNDTTWRFDLGTVAAWVGGSFSITDSVICGHPEIRNLTQCTKATIYPAPNCPPPSVWNGSEISLTGACNNGVVNFGVYNATAHSMADSVDYVIYLDSIQVKVGKIKLAASDSIHFMVQTAGMTATCMINQVAGHPNSAYLSSVIENCTVTSFFPRQMANHFSTPQSPNSKSHCLPIQDSSDPNDKQAFPIGFTANRVVKPGTQMEYLIRFQNTGTDTAYTVLVIDSLDNNLNPETLEVGAVSHPYDISMQTTRHGKTFLRWQFNHINLPDSNTNELRSHGFIQYRISPKPNLPLGSQARNEAAIFFDFNLPVVTNKTLTTFDNLVFTNPALNSLVQIVTSARSLVGQPIGVKIYPNPLTQNELTAEFATKGSLTIFNIQGQPLLEEPSMEGTQVLKLNLPSGIYWLKFQTNEGVRIEKLIKR